MQRGLDILQKTQDDKILKRMTDKARTSNVISMAFWVAAYTVHELCITTVFTYYIWQYLPVPYLLMIQNNHKARFEFSIFIRLCRLFYNTFCTLNNTTTTISCLFMILVMMILHSSFSIINHTFIYLYFIYTCSNNSSNYLPTPATSWYAAYIVVDPQLSFLCSYKSYPAIEE